MCETMKGIVFVWDDHHRMFIDYCSLRVLYGPMYLAHLIWNFFCVGGFHLNNVQES